MIWSFLSRILGWLGSRVLWVTIGVVALFLMIWYAGPLFAFGEMRPLETVSARCWLIGLILAYILLRLLIARWRAGRMNERITGILRSSLSAGPSGEKAQVGILSDRFDEALNVLRKARFETKETSFWGRVVRHGRYVYELPWYVIIGAPGVGKTTALLNSGLSFPLAKQIGAAAIRGAGGTRHCDWWFTNEAVFIDTAGRYTTHETDAEADNAEWRGFLSLLKKNRARQPINGVLVMMSVAELLGQSKEERQEHAVTLRRRLDELRSDLGTSFPVYLLINKCDLLLGFDEYFSTLDRSGRAQVWGYTLPLDPSGKYGFDQEELVTEIDHLQARINAGLVEVLQAESDLARRELIYTFPQQFSVLTLIFKEMTEELLAASRFSESPFLRGVYFTSATQEGTPFDRIVHALEQGFAVQRPQKVAAAGEGKAYFLQELLSKVVFAEAHIAGSDRRAERRSYAWHVGGYVLSVFALAGAALAWLDSYRNNLTHIEEVAQKAKAFEGVLPRLPSATDARVNALLPVLNVAESLPDSAYFKVDRPLLRWRSGLYQGKKLRAGAAPLYRQLLVERLVPTIKANLEQRLRSVDIGDMEFAYDVLKAYLMMYEPKHFNGDEFVAFAEDIWGRGLSSVAERQALVRHVKTLIAMDALVPSEPMDAALVRSTRERLAQYTTSQRIYRSLVRQLQANNPLPEFSVASEIGGQMAQVLVLKSGHPLTHGIPALYTYRGYHELFKKKIDGVLSLVTKDESWVLGTAGNGLNTAQNIASGKLALDVERHYVADYIAYWDRYIADVGVVEPKSLREAAHIVEQLSGAESPLRRFMLGAVRETTLIKDAAPKDGRSPSMMDRAQQTVNNTLHDLSAIVPAGTIDPLAPKDIPALKVNNHFAGLRHFVLGSGGDGANAPMTYAMKRVEDLKMLLADALYRSENNMQMPETVLITQISTSLGNMPEPFKGVLKTVSANGGQAIKAAGTRDINRSLNEEVTSFCKRAIEGRYPFKRSASVGVTPADFADMFGPNGRMEQFRQQLRPGQPLPAAFNQARVIRDVFFRNGSSPQISFTIKPLVMDPTITILNLNIGGQTIRYDHGPQVPTSVTWPGSGNGNVRASLLPTVDSGSNDISASGLWALHQLFDRHGQIRSGSMPDYFEVVLNIGGRRAVFEIRPTSASNPFNLPELRNFQCPRGMPS